MTTHKVQIRPRGLTDVDWRDAQVELTRSGFSLDHRRYRSIHEAPASQVRIEPGDDPDSLAVTHQSQSWDVRPDDVRSFLRSYEKAGGTISDSLIQTYLTGTGSQLSFEGDSAWWGYIVAVLPLIVVVAYALINAGITDDLLFGLVMLGTFAVLFGVGLIAPVRHGASRLVTQGLKGMAVLAWSVLILAQVVYAISLVWSIIQGRLEVGYVWMALIGGWLVAIWWQAVFVVDLMRERIRQARD